MILYVTILWACFFSSSFSHSEKPITMQDSTIKFVTSHEKKESRKKKRLKQETVSSTDVPISCPISITIPTTKTISSGTIPFAKDQLSLIAPTIEFTQEGVLQFFNTFNKPEYTEHFLPHSFSHMRQFFEFAQNTQQPLEFYDGIIHLFHQKIVACPFVNEAAVQRLLLTSSSYFEKALPLSKQSLWKEIKKTLWQNFQKRFTVLTENPVGFFEEVSDEILKKVKFHATTPDRLRYTIGNFIGTVLDKTVWAPQDEIETWRSFKKIGTLLTNLYEKNIIIDDNEINLLYWRLIERYCFFLDLTGSHMSATTYTAIKYDLAEKKVPWLYNPEQEEGLKQKVERLAQAVISAEAQARTFMAAPDSVKI